ncbi:hypothetical protein L5515_011646 [Caenorhabditis briggsae]|uniref:BTB domain-containing protein n=1 Tax=Caenorhabditis briggsae TaxID=6238 RepID=A0AAE9EUV8_CAEBR|nr:hypothetical protein L5515_011646 [Caenorhabditis briggsae]
MQLMTTHFGVSSGRKNMKVSETDKKLTFKLSCNENTANTMWNCKADVEIYVKPILDGKIEYSKIEKVLDDQKTFDYKNKHMEVSIGVDQLGLETETLENYHFEVQTNLRLKRIYGYRKRKVLDYTVEHPRFSNGVIVIDERKIYVNKQILAMHSKYFNNLFFGDFNEKGQSTVQIHEVSYEGFITFLDFIHPTGRRIESSFVEGLMEVADLFMADRVMEYCEEFLIKTEIIEKAQKMIWAEKYSLHNLMNECLHTFKSVKSLLELKKSDLYFDISDEIKSSLLERAVQLHKEKHAPSNATSSVYMF